MCEHKPGFLKYLLKEKSFFSRKEILKEKHVCKKCGLEVRIEPRYTSLVCWVRSLLYFPNIVVAIFAGKQLGRIFRALGPSVPLFLVVVILGIGMNLLIYIVFHLPEFFVYRVIKFKEVEETDK